MPILIFLILAVVGYFAAVFVVIPAISPRPTNLGVTDGALRPCPPSPNCVNSQATRPMHAIPPIPMNGTPQEAQARIVSILNDLPRTEIITQRDGYIHAEAHSALMRFVDDVEFYFDADAGLIHFRSSARFGYSDAGVNRRRMENISATYNSR